VTNLIYHNLENLKEIIDSEILKNEEMLQSQLISKFESDSLFYKRILREIFLIKLCNVFGELNGSTRVVDFLPRSERFYNIKILEKKLDIKLPPMVLSTHRIIFGLIISIIPPLVIIIYLLKNEFVLFPDGIVILTISIIIIPLPIIFVLLVSPLAFSAIDWPNINTVDDLLIEMGVDNFNEYSKDEYKKTVLAMMEIKEMQSTH